MRRGRFTTGGTFRRTTTIAAAVVASVVSVVYATAATAWTLELPESVEVAGPVVTVAQVARGELPPEVGAIVLVDRGRPGGVYTVSRAKLLRELVARRLAADAVMRGATSCRITVTGTSLDRNDLARALTAAVSAWLPEAKPGEPEPAAAVDGELPDVAVAGDWALELVEPRRLRPGRNLVAVRVGDARTSTRFTATILCHAWGEVARLRTSVREDDPVRDEDLIWEWRDLSQAQRGLVIGRDGVAGMCAARTLAAGDELRQGDLKRTPLVRQGEPVELVLGRGGVEVTLRGTARQDGAAGQVVSVRNELDGRLVTGRVVGPGRVAWRK